MKYTNASGTTKSQIYALLCLKKSRKSVWPMSRMRFILNNHGWTRINTDLKRVWSAALGAATPWRQIEFLSCCGSQTHAPTSVSICVYPWLNSFSVPPPVFERFSRLRRQVARFRPRLRRIKRGAFDQFLQRLREPADFFCQRPERRFVRHDAENLIRQPLKKRRLADGSIAPVVQQVMVQVNFHRARFGAGTAE